jgi:hypothetical protein
MGEGKPEHGKIFKLFSSPCLMTMFLACLQACEQTRFLWEFAAACNGSEGALRLFAFLVDNFTRRGDYRTLGESGRVARP